MDLKSPGNARVWTTDPEKSILHTEKCGALFQFGWEETSTTEYAREMSRQPIRPITLPLNPSICSDDDSCHQLILSRF
jgi:hypothetical protein